MPCKVLGACGPGSLRSWELAGFISASSHSSLLSFSLFSFPGSPGSAGKPAAPQHLWDPRSPLVPTCLLCSGAGGMTQQGQHLVKLPSVFFTTFPSQPVWPWLAEPVPPSPSLPGDGRSLGEPHAPPEQANPVLWLFVSQQRWHAAGAVPGGSAARTILYAVGCQKREPSTGFTAAKQGMGLPRGPLPHAQQPQPKAEGGKLPVK